ncbi:uncharacterized protein LOC121857965 [Homarus americanus]|uniref:uncharacterized protein LOC121857965 n=1 Tax=Homarus americanus TaxID=6706 RepID=UPI001C454648|nr:uncharacterized protein LOC121857965 [Homarus americanus]
MATASASEEVGADGLAQMSIEDFLKQEVPQPVPGGGYTFLGCPALPYTYRAYRGLGGPNCRQRRGGGGGRGQGTRGGRGGASSKRAKGGIKPGVIMTHDHPRVRPKSYTTPQSRHLVSVLATGSNEAPAVKERSGGVEDELEAVLTKAHFSYEVTFVLNQPLSVKAGQRCHFLPVRNLSDVRRDTILKLLVGLLNTGARSHLPGGGGERQGGGDHL